NVTIPHKEAALRLVDELAAEARRIGAVNTIVRRASRLVGDNTDGYGFAQALAAARVDVTGKDVLVLGAGGAARACVAALGAARSFTLWTGREAPLAVMRAALPRAI